MWVHLKNSLPMKKLIPFIFIALTTLFVNCGDDSSDVKTGGNGPNTPAENTFNVSNSGTSAYIFTGNGLSNNSNPSLTLTKGVTYTFIINATGHPFWINQTQGTGTSNAYSSGVTGNGTASGTITFTVPNDAPATLFYNCQIHASMTGTITIVSP